MDEKIENNDTGILILQKKLLIAQKAAKAYRKVLNEIYEGATNQTIRLSDTRNMALKVLNRFARYII